MIAYGVNTVFYVLACMFATTRLYKRLTQIIKGNQVFGYHGTVLWFFGDGNGLVTLVQS